ncbi:MAG: 50S ribosomal protein L30e [Archaeoglobaceae archaeon]
MTDVENILRKVLRSGKYYLGSKRTLKALKRGEAKAVIVAKNCPEDVLEEIKKFNVPVYTFQGTNMELGARCGKPFSVAAMAVLEDLE